jgi:hypothetical protein
MKARKDARLKKSERSVFLAEMKFTASLLTG